MRVQERAVATAQTVQRADVEAIARARCWATAFAAEHGMNEARREDMSLAVSEAVTNAVRHAYPKGRAGEFLLEAATDGECLTVRVSDEGCGSESPSFGSGLGLGLGLPIMAELSERLEFGPGRDGVGTVVLMEFSFDPPVNRLVGAQGAEPTSRFLHADHA